jgi:hypothetical protein
LGDLLNMLQRLPEEDLRPEIVTAIQAMTRIAANREESEGIGAQIGTRSSAQPPKQTSGKKQKSGKEQGTDDDGTKDSDTRQFGHDALDLDFERY